MSLQFLNNIKHIMNINTHCTLFEIDGYNVKSIPNE